MANTSNNHGNMSKWLKRLKKLLYITFSIALIADKLKLRFKNLPTYNV